RRETQARHDETAATYRGRMTVEGIIHEAREIVARGGSPDWKTLRDRIRALGGDQREALQRLERVGAVQRARATVAPPRPTPPAAPPRPALLKTRPTITGNMDVRRAEGSTIAWRREPKVVAWELRISARPDPRGDY